MKINSARQLKDRIRNEAARKNLTSNIILQNYMMERLLERIAVLEYRKNLVLKGGFLISAMIGIDLRTTMDLDATVKGLSVDKNRIAEMVSEIISIDINDNAVFSIKKIDNIHDFSDYDDFRISLEARFFTVKVNMKIDITTGEESYRRKLIIRSSLCLRNGVLQ